MLFVFMEIQLLRKWYTLLIPSSYYVIRGLFYRRLAINRAIFVLQAEELSRTTQSHGWFGVMRYVLSLYYLHCIACIISVLLALYCMYYLCTTCIVLHVLSLYSNALCNTYILFTCRRLAIIRAIFEQGSFETRRLGIQQAFSGFSAG